MVNDAERKMMRILYNYSAKYRHMPNWTELVRKTGREKGQITSLLSQLVEKEYLTWDGSDITSIILIKNPESLQQAKEISGSDYFMNY